MALPALLVAGCSGDDGTEVDADALAEGPCQQLAEPLSEVGGLVAALRDGDLDPADDADAGDADGRADAAQDGLRAVRDTADDPVVDAVTGLANDLGVLRVAVATEQVGDAVLDQVTAGRDEVLAACSA